MFDFVCRLCDFVVVLWCCLCVVCYFVCCGVKLLFVILFVLVLSCCLSACVKLLFVPVLSCCLSLC